MRNRAGQPIQLGDDKHVALPDKLQCRLELKPHRDRGDLFMEDLFAARRGKFFNLGLKTGDLINGGGPRLANDHFQSQGPLMH
jgi:hypothetical protein